MGPALFLQDTGGIVNRIPSPHPQMLLSLPRVRSRAAEQPEIGFYLSHGEWSVMLVVS